MQNSFACGNLGNLSNVQIGLLSEFNLRSKMLNSLYKFSETFNFYKKDFDSFKNLSIRSKEINHWSKTFTFFKSLLFRTLSVMSTQNTINVPVLFFNEF